MVSKQDFKAAAYQVRKKVDGSRAPIDPDFIKTDARPVKKSKKQRVLERRKKQEQKLKPKVEQTQPILDRTVQSAIQDIEPEKTGYVNPSLIVFILIWVSLVLWIGMR